MFSFFENETSFFIINKLKVQESYTMRIVGKPRTGGEREDQKVHPDNSTRLTPPYHPHHIQNTKNKNNTKVMNRPK